MSPSVEENLKMCPHVEDSIDKIVGTISMIEKTYVRDAVHMISNIRLFVMCGKIKRKRPLGMES